MLGRPHTGKGKKMMKNEAPRSRTPKSGSVIDGLTEIEEAAVAAGSGVFVEQSIVISETSRTA